MRFRRSLGGERSAVRGDDEVLVLPHQLVEGGVVPLVALVGRRWRLGDVRGGLLVFWAVGLARVRMIYHGVEPAPCTMAGFGEENCWDFLFRWRRVPAGGFGEPFQPGCWERSAPVVYFAESVPRGQLH